MWSKYYIPVLIAGILFLSIQNLRSQDDREDLILDAKLWTSSGDTLSCKILYINQYSFQYRVSEVDTSGNLIKHYSPKDLAGFSYRISDDHNEYNSMLNPEDMGRIFMKKVHAGMFTVFQYLEINPTTTSLSFLVGYYLWKGEWLKPAITKHYEVESLLYHFRDCPELEFQIKTGKLGLNDIRTILKVYESCELTDEYEFFYE